MWVTAKTQKINEKKMGVAENTCWGDVSVKFLWEKHYAILDLKKISTATRFNFQPISLAFVGWPFKHSQNLLKQVSTK